MALYLGFSRLSTIYTLPAAPPFMLAVQALWHVLLFAIIIFSLLGLVFGLTSFQRLSGPGLLKALAGLALSGWPLAHTIVHFMLFAFGFVLCVRNILSIRSAADYTAVVLVLGLIIMLLATPILYRVVLIKYIKNIRKPANAKPEGQH